MSFTTKKHEGRAFAPGWFLADQEHVTRQTRQISQTGATDNGDGTKVVPMGTVWPANDGTAEGIVYENVDVTSGAMPGSVVVRGAIYADRLAVTLVAAAKTALSGKGFTIIDTAPAVTRPY